MSSSLTLLLLCDEPQLHPVLISALEAAEFRLVIANTKNQASRILSSLAVDVVMIHQSNLASSLCPALKRLAPRTPILLIAGDDQQAEAYPGIYSVLRTDSDDEVLARAVAVFFRESLTRSTPRRMSVVHDRDVTRRFPKPGPQPGA